MKRYPDFWIDSHYIVKVARWEKKPSVAYRPIVFADRPLSKDKLKALWVQSEGKPLAFARLIEGELGVREYES